MNAKTIASLLPFFVVSGVSIAGLTSDDPYWYNNNFSQLGDRTTFAARMFNSTLMLAGVCIVIISYFAISELITTHRLQMQYLSANDEKEAPKHFKARILLLSTMLTLAGIAFIGIGMFRYTPHPILHNVFARGLPCLMSVLMIALPWLAPQLSKVVYVISDLAIVIGALAGFQWLAGRNTLTNVEALAGMMFLGWFIIFSRQIAAIESDRVQTQLILAQTKRPESVEDLAEVSETVPGHRFPTLVGSLILVTVHEHSPQTIRRGVTRTDGTSPVLMAIRNRSSLWWAFYRSSATGSFSTAP